MSFNKFTFYKNTFCDFIEVNEKEIVNLQGNFTSKKGSSYYFTSEGVYRRANHWGRVANCRWRLQTTNEKCNQINRIGFAKWSDFYENNETDTLFYIEVNWEKKSINFQHKNNPNYKSEYLRTAKKVSKTIQEIKILFNSDDWSKYLEIDDIETTRKNWIEKLVNTNVSLQELKRKKNSQN